MMSHDTLDEQARDTAALHALGCLPEADATAYENHLACCPACRKEVEALRAVIADLALASPVVNPPTDLRSRLFQRIRKDSLPAGVSASRAEASHSPQTWKTWKSDQMKEGFAFSLASDAVWEPTSVQGVEARRLFMDAANDRVTMLVRMAPGTSYPKHVHSGMEECYVIEGDILVGDVRMRSGDYQRAGGGSIHGVQSTRDGCLLLIVSSLHDELLSPDRP